MNLKTIKSATEIKLPGFTVEGETVNDVLNSVTIRDLSGALVAKFAVESYSFRCLVQAPPKLVRRYQVIGSIHGITVNEIHAERRLADRRAELLNENGGCVTAEEIEIPEEVADAAEADGLPF